METLDGYETNKYQRTANVGLMVDSIIQLLNVDIHCM